jgi:hypothetical protein
MWFLGDRAFIVAAFSGYLHDVGCAGLTFRHAVQLCSMVLTFGRRDARAMLNFLHDPSLLEL